MAKKYKVIGVPWQLKLAKLCFIMRAWRGFIKGSVIIVENIMKGGVNFIVHVGAGLSVGQTLKKISLKSGGQGEGKLGGKLQSGGDILSVAFVGKRRGSILTRLKEETGCFVVGIVPTLLMLRDYLNRGWVKITPDMASIHGIILMEKEPLTTLNLSGRG